jgi:hypothetical protein
LYQTIGLGRVARVYPKTHANAGLEWAVLVATLGIEDYEGALVFTGYSFGLNKSGMPVNTLY